MSKVPFVRSLEQVRAMRSNPFAYWYVELAYRRMCEARTALRALCEAPITCENPFPGTAYPAAYSHEACEHAYQASDVSARLLQASRHWNEACACWDAHYSKRNCPLAYEDEAYEVEIRLDFTEDQWRLSSQYGSSEEECWWYRDYAEAVEAFYGALPRQDITFPDLEEISRVEKYPWEWDEGPYCCKFGLYWIGDGHKKKEKGYI